MAGAPQNHCSEDLPQPFPFPQKHQEGKRGRRKEFPKGEIQLHTPKSQHQAGISGVWGSWSGFWGHTGALQSQNPKGTSLHIPLFCGTKGKTCASFNPAQRADPPPLPTHHKSHCPSCSWECSAAPSPPQKPAWRGCKPREGFPGRIPGVP